MPGNENEIIKCLLQNKQVRLNHFGKIISIGAPCHSAKGYTEVASIKDVAAVSTEDSRKKADIYINGIGVSLKQRGGSFSYNRIQRANLEALFKILNFKNVGNVLQRIDNAIEMFHQGKLDGRNRAWEDFFTEEEFKKLLNFLMLQGSPNFGQSIHTAQYILEAPRENIAIENMNVYSFDEYFEANKGKFKISLRRQWVGQSSQSEHARALSLSRNPGNAPWVFNEVAGIPSSGWREGFPIQARKTVYFLMIEKVA